jgi:hypothetical protein
VSRRVTVPAELMPVLVEALLERLGDAAVAFEALGFDPDGYPEPLERFDTFRNALDAAGWGATASIDLDAHGDAVGAALAERLRVERHAVASGRESVEQGHRGGESQVVRARWRAMLIVAFLHDTGLTPAGGEANGQG